MGAVAPRVRRAVVCGVLAAVGGVVCVGALSLVPLGLLLLATAVGEGVVWQVASGLLVVLASVLLGAAFGASVREKWASSDTFVVLLFLIAALIGAGAGALAFATGGAGVIALAGLMGVAGAAVAARTAGRLSSWLGEHAEGLPHELRRLLF